MELVPIVDIISKVRPQVLLIRTYRGGHITEALERFTISSRPPTGSKGRTARSRTGFAQVIGPTTQGLVSGMKHEEAIELPELGLGGFR